MQKGHNSIVLAMELCLFYIKFNGLKQKRLNSIANTMELCLLYILTSISSPLCLQQVSSSNFAEGSSAQSASTLPAPSTSAANM